MAPIHFLKEFSTVNINNLCRHLTEADFCGQGPDIFLKQDLPELFTAAHSSFFARKFHTHLHDHDDTRIIVKSLAQGAYYHLLQHHLPQQIIKILAQRALLTLVKEESLRGHHLQLSNIHHLRVIPSLSAHDPCCQSSLVSTLRKISDHRLWVDFSFLDITTNTSEDARALLIPTLNGKFCYSDGHLKMALINPWTEEMRTGSNNDTSNRPVVHGGLPLPYGPAHTSQVLVVLMFSTDVTTSVCSGEDEVGIPLTFPEPENRHSLVHVLIRLISPNSLIRCMRHQIISWRVENTTTSNILMSPMIHHFLLDCGSLEPGPWRILLSQANTSDARIYNFPFYLLDYSKEHGLGHQLDHIQHLWQVDEVALLPLPNFYISEDKNSFTGHHQAESDLFHSSEYSLWEKQLAVEHENSQQKPLQRRYSVLMQWFTCNGGLITSVSASLLFYHWLHWQRSVRQRYITFACLLSLGLATTLQTMLAIHYC